MKINYNIYIDIYEVKIKDIFIYKILIKYIFIYLHTNI